MYEREPLPSSVATMLVGHSRMVGKYIAPELFQEPGDADVGLPDAIQHLRSVQALAHHLERIMIEDARAIGWTWERIGNEYGISRQAAHERWAGVDVRAF